MFGPFFCFIRFFIFCQQFLIRFESGVLPGHKRLNLLLLEVIFDFFRLMTGSIILHKHFTSINVKQVQHVLLQYFYVSFAIYFLDFGQEVRASPTHFTRKSSPNHDWIWVFNGWNCVPGIKSIRCWWAWNNGATHTKHLKVTFVRKQNFFLLFKSSMNMLLTEHKTLLHTFS